jgi:hypothetical protein
LGNGAFLAVVAVPRISNLRVVNIVISSTPAASTNNVFIISSLLTLFNFAQWRSAEAGSLPGLLPWFSFSPISNQSNDRIFPARNSWGEME